MIANFVPARAQSIGIEKYRVAFLITIFGICNTIARAFIATISDHPRVSRLVLYIVAPGMMGVVTACIPSLTTYPLFATGMALVGFFLGKCKTWHLNVIFH